ncbi:MAG: type I restriction endonuclease subunit R [Patescibacteria group bacterium]
MKHKYQESSLEQAVLDWLQELGYEIFFGPDISPEPKTPTSGTIPAPLERQTYDDVVLTGRLKKAVDKLNPDIPKESREEALRQVINIPNRSPKLETNNEIFHDMLVNGVDIEYRTEDGRVQGDKVWLIDKENPENNNWLAVNQFRVIEGKNNRVPDIVIFVNGLPLAVFELKNPTKEKTTVKQAYRQFQTYKNDIPSLFAFNELLVISDGIQARTGTITSPWEWFLSWRSVDGKVIAPRAHNETKILVNGAFRKERFLDLACNFVTFHEERGDIKKIIAGYHQYFATNKALEKANQATKSKDDQRIGVIWHTQGSGKSLTMTFFAGKVIKELDNPTIVVITDRNDLDDQLFETFTKSKNLLRQSPKQAESRKDLVEKLDVASGGVIFTTIQKFFPEVDRNEFPKLSERKNIVVIADEAHRSQYGFQAKFEDGTVKYGFAKYVRDALPNASFIGFTATPIALKDKNTTAVFGDVIDTYDITRAVQDEATVPIYYEARLARIGLNEKERKRINREFEDITKGEEVERKEKLKTKWARLEKMVGSEKRLRLVAKDIVNHFEERQNVIEGKGLIVTMSRRIAVDLYEEITKLRPEWHSDELDSGKIKVVMSGSASDPQNFQHHIRSSRTERDRLAQRMKNPEDALKLAIVCDMWLTGFDVPCLHTMYLDKPMHGHSLMQAIARVNRVFRDKPAGLIVDYIGVAHELQKALSYYTKSDQQLTAVPQSDAVQIMKEKYEVVRELFHGFDYMEYFEADEGKRTEIQTEAVDFILSLEDGADRFKKAVTALSQAFSIAIPHEEALTIREEVAFFQAIKAGIVKLEPTEEGGPTEEDFDLAIKQILSNAIVSDEVIDIFEAVGIDRPDVSVLSDEFLAEVQGMEHKNLAFETLKKLLNDEIKEMSRTNLVASRSFLEMLENTIKRYQERTITSAQVIAELVALAKEIKEKQKEGNELDLSKEEIAFYDALAENESAVRELGNEVLQEMAGELLEIIRKNATIDWTKRESVRARLRIHVKRLLKKYDYPPDKQERATVTVLEQAELLAGEWSGENIE